jgi:hypothetical protein
MDGQPAALYLNPERIKKVDTAEWCPAAGQGAVIGENPRFVQPEAGTTWTGEPANAFDSQRYGSERGYLSALALAWRKQPAEQAAKTAHDWLKHRGWDDLKRRIEAALGETNHDPRHSQPNAQPERAGQPSK